MTEMPHVAIVILNWNNPDDTLACLRSVMALDYPADRLLVIVVDNGSRNGSGAQIRAAYPKLTILIPGANLGYAGGNNVGIRDALATGANYIWLLNDDVVVAPESLSTLVQVAVQTPEAACLGPIVLTKESPNHILSAGGLLVNGWEPVHLGIGELVTGISGNVADVDFLSGCALFINALALREIGLLDEDFFVYHEDVEWCYRARRAGWRVLSVLDAKVWHPDTGVRDQESSLVTYYAARNHLLFLRKHHIGWRPFLSSLARYAVWIGNWSINPKWRRLKGKRTALCWALSDFARGNFGRSERFL